MHPGSKHTEEARQRMSERMTAIYADPDRRKECSDRTAESWRKGTRGTGTLQLDRLNAAWEAASDRERLAFIASRLDVRVPVRRRPYKPKK